MPGVEAGVPKERLGGEIAHVGRREDFRECLRHAFPIGESGSFKDLPKVIKREDGTKR